MWDQITEPDDPGFDAHVEAVVSLARAAAASCGPVRVVAVDGRSGAGKTTLATAVARSLAAHGTVGLVHLDRVYPGWDGLAATPSILATRLLRPLAEGSPAAYPVWDWAEGRWDGTVPVGPTDFLVLEGCGSSVGPAGPYAAVRVFLDADQPVRRARGIARDGDVYAPHWERWAAQEDALFAEDGTRARADLVIDTTQPQ